MEDWSILVREQAAFTLWTLAGDKKPQRKMIAERIGIQQILSMVMCKSEKLQYVGAKCMQSLALENAYYQNALLKESGAEQLMRLLKQEKPSDRVVLATVETIAAMCIDIAHVSNERAQNELCERGALKSLLDLIDSEGLVGASYEDTDAASRYNMSRCIVIETAYALACLLLHRDKDELVEDRLDLRFIVGLIDTDNLDLRLEAGLAITVFAFNNNERQYEMKKAGGISYEFYRVFFEDPNVDPIQLAKACFQVVVLARVISDQDLVLLTAMAISKLVHLLLYPDDQVVIQSASFLSSLAHTRAGITDAMVACDAVDILCDRLFHPKSSEVRYTCAVALGYLTFNRTASRLLLHNCRNSPQLFNTLMEQLKLGDPKTYSSATASSRNAPPTTPNSRRGVISRQFVESFETALALGLPKLLMKNRVKFYESDKDSNKPYMSTPREESFYGSRNSSKRGSTMKRDSESPMPRAKTAIGLSFRSQSAPMTVMINALSKAQRAAAVEKAAETVETRPIKSVRPTLGTRPYTQFDIKRK